VFEFGVDALRWTEHNVRFSPNPRAYPNKSSMASPKNPKKTELSPELVSLDAPEPDAVSPDLGSRGLPAAIAHEVANLGIVPHATISTGNEAGKFVSYPDSPFQLYQPYPPAGDQPRAIDLLEQGVRDGLMSQTLLGVTGSGKTFTMANMIARLGRPAVVLAPNKTLAAQLYAEMREFFPRNAVEYFVSYYDYYQPEAYVPTRDLFIEKDSSINEHI